MVGILRRLRLALGPSEPTDPLPLLGTSWSGKHRANPELAAARPTQQDTQVHPTADGPSPTLGAQCCSELSKQQAASSSLSQPLGAAGPQRSAAAGSGPGPVSPDPNLPPRLRRASSTPDGTQPGGQSEESALTSLENSYEKQQPQQQQDAPGTAVRTTLPPTASASPAQPDGAEEWGLPVPAATRPGGHSPHLPECGTPRSAAVSLLSFQLRNSAGPSAASSREVSVRSSRRQPMGGLSLALSREGSVRGTRESSVRAGTRENSMHAGRMSREASARGERSSGNRRRGSGGQDELELDSCGNRTHRGLLVLGDRGKGNAVIPQGCASSDAREAYAPSGPSIREAPDGEEHKVGSWAERVTKFPPAPAPIVLPTAGQLAGLDPMLLTAALQALVVEPEEECCVSAGGDATGPPPGNVQLVGDSDLALTSSPDMPDVRQQWQRTQPLDGQSPVAPSALWDVDSLGAAVMPAILSSSWDTANDAVAAGAYLPPPVQLGGSVPARAPISSNLSPVGKLAAQPLPCELTADTQEWNRSFMKRWRLVKKRAYLQALGLRALWRVNSLSDRHEPLELLTNDLPSCDNGMRRAWSVSRLAAAQLDEAHHGRRGASLAVPVADARHAIIVDGVHKDPSLGSLLLGEVAERTARLAVRFPEKKSPAMSTPLQSQLQSLVLERCGSLLESPSSARRSGRRSFRSEPFLIGVAGGTASGKTTVCDLIIQRLQEQSVVMLAQDSFYKTLSEEDRANISEYNFDQPSAFDTNAIMECLLALKQGRPYQVPVYDFTTHSRSSETQYVMPADVVIIEGILVLHMEEIRSLLNMKVYVDTDDDVRLARRIQRDVAVRGRDVGGVIEQYTKFVKPAFDQYVAPSRKFADVIIPWARGDNVVAIDLITEHIRMKLQQHDLRRIYPNLEVIPTNYQIRGMHTIIRDASTHHADFVFYADRLLRLVVEAGLGHLPFTEKMVVTPTGHQYVGVDFAKKLCGVSIIRSGESMENALRACCKGIKIGKILVHREKIWATMQMPRPGSNHNLNTPRKPSAAEDTSSSSSPAPSPLASSSLGAAVAALRSDSNGIALPAAASAAPQQPHRRTSSDAAAGKGALAARRPSSGVCGSQRQVDQEIVYEKLPADIADRFVMLMDPILGSGNSALRAIQVLLENGVEEGKILFLTVIAAPEGIRRVCGTYPRIKVLTSEIDEGMNDYHVVPGMGEWGDRYFCE